MGSAPDSVIANHLAHVPVVPEFNLPSSLDAWVRQRRETQSTLWRLLGNLPPRPKRPQVTCHGRFEAEHFVTEKFSIDNGAGETLPGVLLLPIQRRARVPALLYCHWHGGEYGKGKVEVFESTHTPEAPAAALARRGFAVLAIDAPCFGSRQGKGPGGPRQNGEAGEAAASKFHLWFGRTLWGMLLRDDLIALDYLATRPEIDPRRIGVTGISMGATRAWWLMALDERLRAGVAVACLTRYQDLIAGGGLNEHGIYYYVPGFLNHFDTEAVLSLVAPRPLLLMNGDRDPGSPVAGIRQIEQKVRKVYGLHGLAEAFDCQVHPGVGHEYTRPMWQSMLAWFEQHLPVT
ncbi:MAG: prolyl oligopeptidase family serine peptidase [Verrucomicrobiae bacterium]|nr:prolyl oligopeptidase family serine peptidase [Verrucomicrobiae bacterium]